MKYEFCEISLENLTIKELKSFIKEFKNLGWQFKEPAGDGKKITLKFKRLLKKERVNEG